MPVKGYRGYVTAELLFPRLLEKISIDAVSQCWVWTGACYHDYPNLRINRIVVRVNRIMAWLFLGYDGSPELEVCHSCNQKRCVNPAHLYLATHRQNLHDAFRDGLWRGSRLNPDKVRSIKQRLKNGERASRLAREFGVCQSTIYYIRSGRIWAGVGEEGVQ